MDLKYREIIECFHEILFEFNRLERDFEDMINTYFIYPTNEKTILLAEWVFNHFNFEKKYKLIKKICKEECNILVKYENIDSVFLDKLYFDIQEVMKCRNSIAHRQVMVDQNTGTYILRPNKLVTYHKNDIIITKDYLEDIIKKCGNCSKEITRINLCIINNTKNNSK